MFVHDVLLQPPGVLGFPGAEGPGRGLHRHRHVPHMAVVGGQAQGRDGREQDR